MKLALKMLKIQSVMEITAYSRPTIYGNIKKGLIPPPVRLGKNSVAWPEYEIRTIFAALVAGKTEDEIRMLVARLIANRQADSEYSDIGHEHEIIAISAARIARAAGKTEDEINMIVARVIANLEGGVN